MDLIVTVLIASAVIAGLSAILVLLIVLADAKFADYGECTITINGEKELKIEGGGSLLSTLMDQDIFIPSACGGRSSCGLCTVKVTDGAGPLLPTEEPLLTSEQIEAQVRLSCQVKVRNDLKIEIPEEIFSIQRYKGMCRGLTDLTHDIKLVQIELKDPASMSFKAGQYIQLEAPAYGKSPEPVYRAYSMATNPQEKQIIELIVRLVPEGVCTTWVHTILKEGDELFLNGPYGDFYLRDTDRDIIFIAGGSGMAPIRSILHQMSNDKNERNACYYFGALSKRDLFMADEMQQFEKDIPNFHYIPALSKPADDDEWEGKTGLITDIVKESEGDMTEKEAYLCGSPGMIDACIKVLTGGGIPEERIYYDKFA